MYAVRVVDLPVGPSGITNIVIPRQTTERVGDDGRYSLVQPVMNQGNVVYYLEHRDGLIKVGTTNELRSRRRKLAYEFGPLCLLAWEPGSFDLEHQRHQRFARERTVGEWFKPSRRLIAHVTQLRGDA